MNINICLCDKVRNSKPINYFPSLFFNFNFYPATRNKNFITFAAPMKKSLMGSGFFISDAANTRCFSFTAGA
jgi:hypothetical protein